VGIFKPFIETTLITIQAISKSTKALQEKERILIYGPKVIKRDFGA
jgi:hypothetical protein